VAWRLASTIITVFKPPVDTSPSTYVYLRLPSVYPGRRTSTTTCRHILVYLRLPLSTSGYLKWTAFGYLRLTLSTSVSLGRHTPSEHMLPIWAHLGFPCVLDFVDHSPVKHDVDVSPTTSTLVYISLPRRGSIYSHLQGRHTVDSGELGTCTQHILR
jgi:hypothetical protein